ncbi:hypothetical protein QN362_10350 [Actimicrobium sp. CCC2.4]|uniref:hypothetical protein n=1 Tax=Actimicrobium sp. CCC2.4 TaxID=3048606 RepID=UPI002AC8CE4E|nr:hypothetical protein [Actimicrobium sp. CCC2.4]MEB0135728.1 hypothetical protein [Actimicrobium sp. CCC2.4]WPX33715.1 hypothetical protein RHM62_07820 [Actimicrobium sp. CCC2.4]
MKTIFHQKKFLSSRACRLRRGVFEWAIAFFQRYPRSRQPFFGLISNKNDPAHFDRMLLLDAVGWQAFY